MLELVEHWVVCHQRLVEKPSLFVGLQILEQLGHIFESFCERGGLDWWLTYRKASQSQSARWRFWLWGRSLCNGRSEWKFRLLGFYNWLRLPLGLFLFIFFFVLLWWNFWLSGGQFDSLSKMLSLWLSLFKRFRLLDFSLWPETQNFLSNLDLFFSWFFWLNSK